MGITEILRRIWLFSANKIKSSESFSKQPTQLIIKLNLSLWHKIVTKHECLLSPVRGWIATSEWVYQAVCVFSGISILLRPDQSLFKMSKSSQVLHISICEHVNKLKMQHVWLCLAFVVDFFELLNLHFHSNQNVSLPNFSGYIKKLDDEEHGRLMMSRNTLKSLRTFETIFHLWLFLFF